MFKLIVVGIVSGICGIICLGIPLIKDGWAGICYGTANGTFSIIGTIGIVFGVLLSMVCLCKYEKHESIKEEVK